MSAPLVSHFARIRLHRKLVPVQAEHISGLRTLDAKLRVIRITPTGGDLWSRLAEQPRPERASTGGDFYLPRLEDERGPALAEPFERWAWDNGIHRYPVRTGIIRARQVVR